LGWIWIGAAQRRRAATVRSAVVGSSARGAAPGGRQHDAVPGRAAPAVGPVRGGDPGPGHQGHDRVARSLRGSHARTNFAYPDLPSGSSVTPYLSPDHTSGDNATQLLQPFYAADPAAASLPPALPAANDAAGYGYSVEDMSALMDDLTIPDDLTVDYGAEDTGGLEAGSGAATDHGRGRRAREIRGRDSGEEGEEVNHVTLTPRLV
jgi:hypothetical protein